MSNVIRDQTFVSAATWKDLEAFMMMGKLLSLLWIKTQTVFSTLERWIVDVALDCTTKEHGCILDELLAF